MQQWLWVGIGGFVGANLRFFISQAAHQWFVVAGFPVGTFLVNMIGCLCIGALAACAAYFDWLSEQIRLLLMVGLLGSLTTFSTFGLDSIQLIKQQAWFYLVLNVGGQVVFGLLLVWLGYYLVTLLSH